jgi:osmoprotectant transport system permease protein
MFQLLPHSLAFLSAFSDAFNFIFHQQESQLGSVQVGGLHQVGDFAWEQFKVTVYALALSLAVALPAGIALGYKGAGELLAVAIGNAGRAILEVIRKVQLPLAVPTIMAGVRTAATAIVATATIAPLAGVLTLGDFILSRNVYGDTGVVAGAILVALMALAIEIVLAGVQWLLTPKPMRSIPVWERRPGFTSALHSE